MKKRRKFSPEFKSKVALEALRERDPVHEIAKRYQVHPSQVMVRDDLSKTQVPKEE